METYSIRNRGTKHKRSATAKASPLPVKRVATGFAVPQIHPGALLGPTGEFVYICNECFGPVLLKPGDDIVCTGCQSRCVRKPRTQRKVWIRAE